MGQHKTNPTAIAAANGELPDKPKKMCKREAERELQRMIWQKMVEVAPEVVAVVGALSSTPYEGNKQ